MCRGDYWARAKEGEWVKEIRKVRKEEEKRGHFSFSPLACMHVCVRVCFGVQACRCFPLLFFLLVSCSSHSHRSSIAIAIIIVVVIKSSRLCIYFPFVFFLFPSFLMDSNFAPYFFLSHFTFYSLLFLKLLLLLIMDKDRVAEDT